MSACELDSCAQEELETSNRGSSRGLSVARRSTLPQQIKQTELGTRAAEDPGFPNEQAEVGTRTEEMPPSTDDAPRTDQAIGGENNRPATPHSNEEVEKNPIHGHFSSSETLSSSSASMVNRVDVLEMAPSRVEATPSTSAANLDGLMPSITSIDNGKRRVAVTVIACLAGMGMSTFVVLAGGKLCLFMLKDVCRAIVFGIVDIVVIIDDNHLDIGQARAPPSHPQSKVIMRGLCWIAIGVIRGTLLVLRYITFDRKREGIAWQPQPLLCTLSMFLVVDIWLISVVMMRAHRDRRRNAFKFWVCMISGEASRWIGMFSPFPVILMIAKWFQIFVSTFGLYYLVSFKDRRVERSDVKNGYKVLVGCGGSMIPFATLALSSASLPGGVLTNSGILTVFNHVCLLVVIPMVKLCFGADERKLWSYFLPAFMLSVELGPCLLFLRSSITSWDFWALLCLQEMNSVIKNTGQYIELYVFLSTRLGRSVSQYTRDMIEERRSTIAPCDNLGEMASPVVIFMVMMCEWVFDGIPGLNRAPYVDKEGIWGVLGGRRHQLRRDESVVMLFIVLMVRLVFCYCEMSIRNRQRRKKATRDCFDDDHVLAIDRERSSMVVLYNRIFHDTSHMQCFAFAAFALQPVFFIVSAARLGKEGG